MHPTRQKLLDTGLAIATDKGLRGLTVRELAAAAEHAERYGHTGAAYWLARRTPVQG